MTGCTVEITIKGKIHKINGFSEFGVQQRLELLLDSLSLNEQLKTALVAAGEI